MGNPNDELIKKSNEAFRAHIKDISKEGLKEVVKITNYF
tara:strand:- start:199 stop:315 length:117 start_codon:yes stop_codon:yes gene_type:complete